MDLSWGSAPLKRLRTTGLYYALAYPYLSYCNLIWAINYPSRLERLVYLQKRIIRLIAGVRKWEHCSPYFIKFKVLSIDQIRDFQIGNFFLRLELHLLPPVFNNCLPHAYTRFTLTILEMPLNLAQLRLVLIYEFTLL